MSTHRRHGTPGRPGRVPRSRPGSGWPTTAILLGAVLLAVPACGDDEPAEEGEATAAATDSPAAMAPPGSPDAMTGVDSQTRAEMQRFRQVAQRLNQLQQRALEDSALQAQQAALQQRIEGAVMEIDPEAEQKLTRLQEIQSRLQTATAEGGVGQAQMDSLRPVLTEARRLQRQLQEARNQAMQRQAVVEQLEDFRADLLAEMQELDPDADSLVALAESLSARLQAGRGAAPGPGAADTAPPLEP